MPETGEGGMDKGDRMGGTDERPRFENGDGLWMARSVWRQEVCLRVCTFAKWEIGEKKKKEELILTSPSPPPPLPPSLVWQRRPELPLTFMQTTKGSGNE